MYPSDCGTHSGSSILHYPFSPGQHRPSDVIGRTGTEGEQDMYVGVNEERLLLRSMTIKPERLNLKGVLTTFFVVVGIYVFSMGAGKYIIRSYFDSQSTESLIKLPTEAQKGFRCQADASRFQTCWEDCAGSYLPVLGGIDVVAYQAIDPGEAPVYGNQWHEALYGGYRFWFVSEANKALFQELPVQYTPEWGGFCSWGISRQRLLSPRDLDPRVSPTSWLITDEGKLHLFRSEEAKTAFQDNLIETLMNGNKVWDAWWGEGAVPGAEGAGGTPLNTGCICEADSCFDA